MYAKCPKPSLDPVFCGLFVWGPFANYSFQSHELKPSLEIPLQTDHIYSTATRGAAVSLSINLLDCLSQDSTSESSFH